MLLLFGYHDLSRAREHMFTHAHTNFAAKLLLFFDMCKSFAKKVLTFLQKKPRTGNAGFFLE